MLADEGRDEEVAVVVALLAADGDRAAGLGDGGFDQFGLQLVFQEAVGQALVDQDIVEACPGAVLDQRAGVVGAPSGTVWAEIGRHRLVAPRAVQRRDDRREGADRLEEVRVAQGDGQRAVAAHRMAEDPPSRRVQREGAVDGLQQVLGDVRVHLEVRRPRGLGGVDIEARALPQVVGRIVRHALATRRRVRRDDGHAMLGSVFVHARLHREIVLGAGQARQPDEIGERPLPVRRPHRELHRRAGAGAVVLAVAQGAAVNAVRGRGFDGH